LPTNSTTGTSQQFDPGGDALLLDTPTNRRSQRKPIPTDRYGTYVSTNDHVEFSKPESITHLPPKKYFARAEAKSKVAIAQSTLPNANQGLFATKKIKEGEHFAYYNGELTSSDLIHQQDLLKRNCAVYMDDKRKTLVWGSPESEGYYINDPLDDNKCNCKITHNNGQYTVVALRNIYPWEELFLAYGEAYWRVYWTVSLKDKIISSYPAIVFDEPINDTLSAIEFVMNNPVVPAMDTVYLNVLRKTMNDKLPRTKNKSAVCRSVKIEALDNYHIVPRCTYDSGASSANYIGLNALQELDVHSKLTIEACSHTVKLGDGASLMTLTKKVTIAVIPIDD